MTVCESCKELCDGLGPYCYECQIAAEYWLADLENDEETVDKGDPP